MTDLSEFMRARKKCCSRVVIREVTIALKLMVGFGSALPRTM